MLITFADREELVRAIGPGHIDTMVELGQMQASCYTALRVQVEVTPGAAG